MPVIDSARFWIEGVLLTAVGIVGVIGKAEKNFPAASTQLPTFDSIFRSSSRGDRERASSLLGFPLRMCLTSIPPRARNAHSRTE